METCSIPCLIPSFSRNPDLDMGFVDAATMNYHIVGGAARGVAAARRPASHSPHSRHCARSSSCCGCRSAWSMTSTLGWVRGPSVVGLRQWSVPTPSPPWQVPGLLAGDIFGAYEVIKDSANMQLQSCLPILARRLQEHCQCTAIETESTLQVLAKICGLEGAAQ